MKQKILYGILFLFLTGMLSGCAGKLGSQKEVSIPAEELQKLTDICGGDDRFYAVAKDKILVLNRNGEVENTWQFSGCGISNIAYQDALYALDVLNMRILKISEDGEQMDTISLSISMDTVIDFEVVDETVFLSCSEKADNGQKSRIYWIDWENGENEVFLEEEAFLSASGERMLYTEKNGRIRIYEISEGKPDDGDELSAIGAGKQVQTFCADEDLKIYYVSENALYEAEGSEYSYLHRLDDNYDVIAEADDMLLLLKRFEKLTLATKQPEEADQNSVLRLYGTGIWYPDAQGNTINLAEEFEAKYGVAVQRTEDTSMNLDSFLTDLMSGSEKYDIYRFWAMNEAAENFIAYHAYEDLSGEKNIVRELDLWYPVIAEACRSEEEIFGVPGGVGLTLLYYNHVDYPELTDADFQTWDQFLDVLEKYHQPVAFNKLRLKTVLLEQYACSYCDTQNKQYEFDTPAFRKVLRLIKRIDGMDVEYSDKVYDETNLFSNKELVGFDGAESYVYGGYSFVLLPSIDGEEPVAPFTMGYHVVNPNSVQKENAFSFMEMLARQRQYFGMDTAQKYPKLAEVMNNSAKLRSGSQPEYGTSIDKYLSGEITEDEAILEIQERTDRKIKE